MSFRLSFFLGIIVALVALGFAAQYTKTAQPSLSASPHSVSAVQPIIHQTVATSTTAIIPSESKIDGAMVTLTFDDGFRSTYEHAIPILDKAGSRSTQYIITHKFDDPKYMTKDQVRELARQGHEIGAHSQTHPNLTSLSLEKAKQEIAGSKKDLENLGINVNTFAYPVGKYNQQIIQLVKDAGFVAARTTHAGYNTKTTNPYELVRYQVQWNATFPEVKHWIDGAVQQKAWLILLFHRIDEDDEPTSSRHELLQQIVDYLVQQKISIVTLKEGVNLLFTKD